jgi:hypothetical protein
MKKTYINPNMVVVKIATQQQMLTTSDPNSGAKFDPSSSSSTMDSRSSFWDDED